MRHLLAILACPWLLLTATAPAQAADPLWLVRDGQPQCTIIRGAEDDFAAERLQRWFAENTGAKVEVVVAGAQPLPTQGGLILLGSAASNPTVAEIAKELPIDVAPEGLTEQGYLAKRVCHDGRDWLVLAGGGRDGTQYAVVDLFQGKLQRDGKSVWLASLDTRQVPRFRYRWFWNWDNRMDWGGAGPGGTTMAAGAKAYTYTKAPDAFLTDGKHCIDFMADHKFNGLILWGFLRDDHGGVEASQELCRYAARRGIRILPGVGTSGYGGYYYSGRNEFNSHTWLAAHPELRAIAKNGEPHGVPCPTKKANQDWLDRGAEWLFRNFEIGGVNLEMGDFFVCYCDDCKRARAAIPSSEPDYYKDMAVSHRITLQTMRRLAPNAWLSYATYTGYDAAMMANPPQFLEMIPDDAICQWTLTRMARQWPTEVRPMAKHNLGYLHWCNLSTHTSDNFYLEEVQKICRQASAAGFEGLDTYGELSGDRPNAELFYLAWEAFLWNPQMTIEQFVDERLAPLYGGAEPARALVKLIPLVQTANERANPENLARARESAVAVREAASPEGRPRWDRLVAYLDRHEQAARAKLAEQQRLEAERHRGQKIEPTAVRASDEDPERGWSAAKAVDGSVEEPQGYWLTRRNDPQQAWLELSLAKPTKINRIVLFHQLTPGHYRSLDYTLSVRTDGQWKQVVAVKDNEQAGWVVHPFETVTADSVRLEITRSMHGSRMGVGEIQLRMVDQ